MIVHHNNLKKGTVPLSAGTPFCSVREVWDPMVAQADPVPSEGIGPDRGVPAVHHRRARLRQNAHPSLRFGDLVSH